VITIAKKNPITWLKAILAAQPANHLS
jgi:hypothetical protein